MTGVAPQPPRPARILIVDDEPLNRQLLELMLGHDQFIVLTASSGAEALRMIGEQEPDVIVLDLMMPRMDGFEVAGAIKGNPATSHIPIIILTALDDRSSLMLALEAGAEEFLTKPVDCDELRTRVRNLARLKACGDYHREYSGMLEGEVVSRTAVLVARVRALEQEMAALRIVAV